MKRILAGALLCMGTTLSAQTDMTSRIVNPSFEDEREGWEIHQMGCQGNDAFKLKAGKIYLETWTGRGGHVQDGRIKQEIAGLPAGTYTVSCVAQNIQEDQPKEVQTGVWVYAGGAKTAVNVAGKYSVTTTTVSGKLEIGFTITGATGNYVCVDDFHLTLEEPNEETYSVFREELGKLIVEAEGVNRHLSTPEQVALDAALAEAKAVVDGTSDKDVTVVYKELGDAIFNYRFSLASPEEPLDVTQYMVNPDFENSTKGWVNDEFSSQMNNDFTLKQGTTYLEKWGWETAGDAHIYQDVQLPNGNYRLTVLAQNIKQSSASSKQKGAYVYGNTAQLSITLPKKYTLDFVVVDGVARVGARIQNCTGNYVCFDDFHLYYTGIDVTTLFAELNGMIGTGEELLQHHQHVAAKAALAKAVDEAKAVSDADNVTTAASALRAAIEASQKSVNEYATFLAAIEAVEKSYAEGNEAETFKAAIDKARAMYNAATAEKEEMDAMTKELQKAEIIYLAANGTGTVPTVITYNFVPEGATGALGRLKVKGVSESRIKYQGYCWAKHPDPTLADDFVKDGEKLYDYPGLIYVMEPLEPATEYYVRAFAMTKTNAVGYGEVRRIITLPMGKCTWSYAYNGEEADNIRLAQAAESAMWYYNHWTNIQDYGIHVSFDPGDASAHCSYGGWMTVGPNAGYQRTGTVLHESGHGIGHGQIWQWSWAELKGDPKWVAETDGDGGIIGGEVPNKGVGVQEGSWWQGERSNMMVHFLTDGQDLSNGDWGHCGPFGINGAGADNGTRILYIANTLQIQGMGEDGMPPSGGSATPYYSFRSIDSTLYYLSCEKAEYGGGTKYLYETNTGVLKYTDASALTLAADSSYAWNIIFQPQTCYYYIRNAKSGRYFTFKSGSIKSAEVSNPGDKESFHLMPARYYTRLGDSKEPVKVKGYWIMEGIRSQWCAPALQAGAGKSTSTTAQVFENARDDQRWLILTYEQAAAIDDARVAAGKEKLERYLAGAKAMLAVPHHDIAEEATGKLSLQVANIEAGMDNLVEPAAVEAAIAETTTAIVAYLNGSAPNDFACYDLSFMIENRGMESLDEWTITGATPTLSEGVGQVTGTKFELSQTLPKLPAGVYRVSVQAFQRPGVYRTVATDYAAGTDNVNTNLFLRNTSNKAPIHNIMDDAQEAKIGSSGEVVANKLYIPNTIKAAANYFNAGLYVNNHTGDFNVTSDTRLKIGLSCTSSTTITNNWVVFDNFALYYYGSEVTADEVGINRPEMHIAKGNGMVYDLSGRAVNSSANTKGIYIQNGKKVVKH